MRRHFSCAKSEGSVCCILGNGERVVLPVIQGIMKHADAGQLADLLRTPSVARKYTHLALQKSAWPVLRQFPRDWLLNNLPEAEIRDTRRRALRFLLHAGE